MYLVAEPSQRRAGYFHASGLKRTLSSSNYRRARGSSLARYSGAGPKEHKSNANCLPAAFKHANLACRQGQCLDANDPSELALAARASNWPSPSSNEGHSARTFFDSPTGFGFLAEIRDCYARSLALLEWVKQGP